MRISKMVRVTGLLALALTGAILTACGGGGSSDGTSGSGSVSSSSSSITPTINVTLSATSQSVTVPEGNTVASGSFMATQQTTVSTPVVADVRYDTDQFASVTATPGTTPSTYNIAYTVKPDTGGGALPISFRLCQDVGCTIVYPGSTQVFTINMSVTLGDWTTTQRNAAHTGYVNASFDPARFGKIWEWTIPEAATYVANGATAKRINSVVTAAGTIYLSNDDTTSLAYALNETDGSVKWRYAFSGFRAGLLSYDNGRLYAASGTTALAINATTPAEIFRVDVSDPTTDNPLINIYATSMFSQYEAPTLYNGKLYILAGGVTRRGTLRPIYVTVMSSFDAVTGAMTWKKVTYENGTMYGQSAAADSSGIYAAGISGAMKFTASDGNYSGSGGAISANLDSNGKWSSPLLGSLNNLLHYLGDSQKPDFSSGQLLLDQTLVSKNKDTLTTNWTSATSYQTVPAIANGVIYTGRMATAQLDALKESDGSVLWSWTAPAGETRFVGNVVAAHNLIFVSTEKTVYAIDVKTHQPVWSYPAAGTLSISAGNVLYIRTLVTTSTTSSPVSAYNISDGRLIAIKLK
jgi:outer membrane protein assembly factor BamB